MTCSIAECDRPVRARALCSRHYQRWQRHGDPLVIHRAEPGTWTAAGDRHCVTEWKRRNRERVREGERRRNAETKRRCFALFGGVCQRCGFADIRALQLDHRDGASAARGTWHRAGLGLYRQILRGALDRAAFQLLCANCNWIKRWEAGECRRAVAPVATSL